MLPTAEELIRLATQHARAGRAQEMLLALHESRALDGLKRRLSRRWAGMNDGDLHDCITQAISTAYDKVREDGSLANLDKWIILVANRRAIDAYRRAASRPALQDPEILSTYRDHRDPSRHQLYRRAIEVARALVRRMKLNNVRRAMEIHIDAVDRGEEVSHREVGEALGVPRDTAKMLRSRGLQRLTKMAEDDGLIQEEFGKSLRELMSLENDDHDDHDDAEENE